MIVLHPACATSPARVRGVQQSTGLLASCTDGGSS